MQTGETRTRFPAAMSPLEKHPRQLSLDSGAMRHLHPETARLVENAALTSAALTTISTCQQVLSSSCNSNNNNNDNNIHSQQLIYSTNQQPQQQQVAALSSNFQHLTPALTGAHNRHEPKHDSSGGAVHLQHHHDKATDESYLYLRLDTNHHHHHHHHHHLSNLVRKPRHKHQSHNYNQQQQQQQQYQNASKAKRQIAEYAAVAAKEAGEQQQRKTAAAVTAVSQPQSLLAATATSGARSPVMLVSSPEMVATHEASVVPMPMHYSPAQPTVRVNSISAMRRQVTPISYSPTPSSPESMPHARSMSFSAASPAHAGLSLDARGQLRQPKSGELCYSSDTSASYHQATNMATAWRGDPYACASYQTPSLLSSSACSSIGSPARPASLLNSQPSLSPAPPITHSSAGSILYDNNGQQQHQQQHCQAGGRPPMVYQHAQAKHHSYVGGGGGGGGGGGNSSTPSGGSSTISASDSLNMGINLEQYISKRNERERSRVRNVNDAFDNLKSSLPLEVERMSKRMSKVEILRTAIGYIRDLEHMLGCSPDTRTPSGGNGSGQRAFRASSERDHHYHHHQLVTAPARALRREFAGLGNTTAEPLHNSLQRHPLQPDLNHNNHYEIGYDLHNGCNGVQEYSASVAKGEAHECRHDKHQQHQHQQMVMMTSCEEY